MTAGRLSLPVHPELQFATTQTRNPPHVSKEQHTSDDVNPLKYRECRSWPSSCVVPFFLYYTTRMHKRGVHSQKHGRTRTLSWANHCLHFASQININEGYCYCRTPTGKQETASPFSPSYFLSLIQKRKHTHSCCFYHLVVSLNNLPPLPLFFLHCHCRIDTPICDTHTCKQKPHELWINTFIWVSHRQTLPLFSMMMIFNATKGTYCAGIFKEHFGVSTSCFWEEIEFRFLSHQPTLLFLPFFSSTLCLSASLEDPMLSSLRRAKQR